MTGPKTLILLLLCAAAGAEEALKIINGWKPKKETK